jgi:predicted nuclease of restriction endonuclease-like RecB superfamily
MLYPKLLRDDSILPKIRIAIRHFDSLVGKERRELDPELLVQFFGDYKVARCIIASMERTYQYRARELRHVVSAESLAILGDVGIVSPITARLHLYDHLNAHRDGFLRRGSRVEDLSCIEDTLGLRRGEFEPLLSLDDDERAILQQAGPSPEAEDVVAQYNLKVLETVLRRAECINLQFDVSNVHIPRVIHSVCTLLKVDYEVRFARGTTGVTLLGRQDSLGSWSRQGRKLARACLQLLERAGDAARSFDATVLVRDRAAHLRLAPDTLAALGSTGDGAGWSDLPDWDSSAIVLGFAASRPSSARIAVRRAPDPSAWEAGVIVPDVLLYSGPQRVIVVAVRSARHGTHLAAIAKGARSGDSLVFTGTAEALAPLHAIGATVVPAAQPDLALVAEAIFPACTALVA